MKSIMETLVFNTHIADRFTPGNYNGIQVKYFPQLAALEKFINLSCRQSKMDLGFCTTPKS